MVYGSAGSITILIAALSILVGLNLNSERQSINRLSDQLVSRIEQEIGKVGSPAVLNIETIEGTLLEGQKIPIYIYRDKDGSLNFSFTVRISNTGKSWSGPIALKLYATPPLKLKTKTIKGLKYKTEIFLDQYSLAEYNLPPNSSIGETFYIVMDNNNSQLKPGDQIEMQADCYFGDSKTTSEFTAIVKQATSRNIF